MHGARSLTITSLWASTTYTDMESSMQLYFPIFQISCILFISLWSKWSAIVHWLEAAWKLLCKCITVLFSLFSFASYFYFSRQMRAKSASAGTVWGKQTPFAHIDLKVYLTREFVDAEANHSNGEQNPSVNYMKHHACMSGFSTNNTRLSVRECVTHSKLSPIILDDTAP